MIKNIVEGKPHNLIESVAERIAQDILQESDMVESVRIRIEKPHVAVPGVVD
jgi:dihydroneopterin aldolase